MVEAWALVENGTVVDSHRADRLVPWWSFTKTVLAAAALVLVRDGLIGLDEPVEDKPYTLRHLLQHRSGLANYGGLRAYHEAVERGEDPWPVPELLNRLDAARLRYPAGEGWDYSNIGYLVVGQLIETIVGSDLDATLQRLVLEPLRIGTARLARERAELDHVAMDSAEGYHPGWVYHGLLLGSVADAAFLLDRLLEGSLLTPELSREMFTPLVLPGPIPERPWQSPGYGLGTMIGETTSGLVVGGHTGGGPGSTIAVYRSLTGAKSRTAAFFRTSQDEAKTEEGAFRLLKG
ncbi:CubicO group peptidase (beta-lactamase class C family) [Microvirga lupini]|uniref:CubicO group peptidase (Beta-lactamase class C family) n=1 Tax=Microvirga lupini TaxID=420324 RepID=A0A7W4YW97_9HYPH|nr:serine hydrolase domain-containing protein [Microvirga lupini]MBB3019282.1 CubicO group peptidase (beta-lactamase class C family) [Microvirga lupini]